MGVRSFRSGIGTPLLALLLLGASAAAPSLEHAVRSARTAIDRGDWPAAETIIDGALKTFGARDAEGVWTLRVMRGEIHNSRSLWEETGKALAFELPPKYRHTETAIQHLIQRAYALHFRGDPAAAQLLESAKAIALRHRPAALADVYRAWSVVDAGKGEEYAREALRLARKHGRAITELKATTTVALYLARQERLAQSIEMNEQALVMARRLGLGNAIQNIEGNLGWAYAEVGDYETAAELFAQAEATAARIGARMNRVTWLLQLGNICFQRRDWPCAERYNRQAVALADRQQPDRGTAYGNLSRIAIETGRFDEARRWNAESRKAKQLTGDEEGELVSDILEARILLVTGGDPSRAEALLRKVAGAATRSGNRLEAEARLAEVYARTKRHALAVSHYERAVAAARAARNEVSDRDLRFAFFHSVAEMFDAYVDFLVSTGRIDEALAVTETSRAESLEEGLVRAEARKPDPRAVARQNGAVILSYWLGRDRSYLWVIRGEGTKLHVLPPDTTIETAVEAYRRDLLGGARSSLELSGARGEALYRMLIAPAGVAKGERVVIIADGQLHTLNFETLVAPAPRRYWIHDVIAMNAGSLQLLARGVARAPGASQMLLIGNAPPADAAFPPLPHAATEMRLVARRFEKATLLEGARATPAAYREAAPGTFDYLHFVAHAVPSRKRPLDSAVILARDAKSYKLLARDVVAQPLRARLVTISSCHGAGARAYAGEGVVGLAWAFQRAGADQVIAALWEVNDRATPDLMDRMYAGIRAGRDPAVALREAKLTLVRSTGSWRKPRYWAPFVLYAGT